MREDDKPYLDNLKIIHKDPLFVRKVDSDIDSDDEDKKRGFPF